MCVYSVIARKQSHMEIEYCTDVHVYVTFISRYMYIYIYTSN